MALYRCLAVTLVLAIAATGCREKEDSISMKSLLPEMTDLERLAEFPAPSFTCKQFSSYNRASVTNDGSDAWFANEDFGQYLRVEDVQGRKEHVMMDADGPGAIVLIWIGNPQGAIRIYLDGNPGPVLECAIQKLLGGNDPGLPRPIAGIYSTGWNLYLPIPYAKRCKVTCDSHELFYRIDYRTYPAGTKVTSFTSKQWSTLRPDLERLAEKLEKPGLLNKAPALSDVKEFDAHLVPGASAAVGSFTGEKALRLFHVTWPVSADRDEPALRSTVLTMTFDGETTVEVPLGDFFGSAPGINPYESLPFTVTRDGSLDCRWVMPFKKSAEITLRNLCNAAVTVKGRLETAPYRWTDETMLFHSKWRASYDVDTRPIFDWNTMTATGRGVFAGLAFSIDNPVCQWWGEGDEKIYVDGEVFPSHFGTGTEDYFGFAWSWTRLFSHAYHAQTRCDGPQHAGRTSMNRFHVLDGIPFQKKFVFDMEVSHWLKCRVNLSATDYWYAFPGANDQFKPITPDDVRLRPVPGIGKMKLTTEAERMRIIEHTGELEMQCLQEAGNGRVAWWTGGQKPGDKLVIGFEVSQAGAYRVIGRFVKAVNYAMARIAINDRDTGRPVDFFYDKGVYTIEDMDLGVFDLKRGENRITFTILGANEKGSKAYMIGFDSLTIDPE